jgi:hypothetical protein
MPVGDSNASMAPGSPNAFKDLFIVIRIRTHRGD